MKILSDVWSVLLTLNPFIVSGITKKCSARKRLTNPIIMRGKILAAEYRFTSKDMGVPNLGTMSENLGFVGFAYRQNGT